MILRHLRKKDLLIAAVVLLFYMATVTSWLWPTKQSIISWTSIVLILICLRAFFKDPSTFDPTRNISQRRAIAIGLLLIGISLLWALVVIAAIHSRWLPTDPRSIKLIALSITPPIFTAMFFGFRYLLYRFSHYTKRSSNADR